ncbi:hypothetical protein SBOR_8591 [Sclerotinia borealis F-4128]|uniref:3-beta hydroxysteroid dehydrogenase/isomerase domain-containing protein n=1 Tax=Sclerotinia borealis (strain F-4128) TaxID=1432307 RepID=W9C8X3_SCLBF|nr:hypothetical protein SBOR_8591 [Sclerotinia borealis F-4128]
MQSAMQEQHLGNVLVVGGCGFMGHHLVKALLKEAMIGQVSVFSRNPRENRHPGVSYHTGDISSFQQVSSLLEETMPRVIFHVASPDPYVDPPNHLLYRRVNVDGTANLLACAAVAPSVVALVYTSSLTVYGYDDRGEILNADETHHILNGPVTKEDPYPASKALADAQVLVANNPSFSRCNFEGCSHPHLRTACVRIPGIYGEGDENMTMLGLQLARYGLSSVQLGNNTTLFDPIYVGNAVFGHMLAAKALLTELRMDIDNSRKGINPVVEQSGDQICGEAFNITDDLPSPFWFYMRKFYAAAGYEPGPRNIWIVPTSLVFFIALVTEYFFWIVFRGKRRPQILIRSKLEHLCMNRTYNVNKAKKRLGWYAIVPIDAAIESSVKWGLDRLTAEKRR